MKKVFIFTHYSCKESILTKVAMNYFDYSKLFFSRLAKF